MEVKCTSSFTPSALTVTFRLGTTVHGFTLLSHSTLVCLIFSLYFDDGSPHTSTEIDDKDLQCFEEKRNTENINFFPIKCSCSASEKNLCILHGQVSVMSEGPEHIVMRSHSILLLLFGLNNDYNIHGKKANQKQHIDAFSRLCTNSGAEFYNRTVVNCLKEYHHATQLVV